MNPGLEVLLPVLLAMAGIIGISPFAIMRFLSGDYALAAIDAVVVITECVIVWAIYSRGAIRQGSIAMSVLCAVGVVAAVHVKGGLIILWIYPIFVTMFFLLKPMESLVGTGLATIAMSSAIVSQFTPLESKVIFTSILITCMVSAAFAAVNAEQRRRLKELSLRDPLTGAENRRAMDETMSEVIATARESQTSVSLIMVDIDYFKRINDQHGHAIGDQVLSVLSEHIRTTIRTEDRLFRVGGEEFAVITKGSGLRLAYRLGEMLRKSIAELDIPSLGDHDQSLSITVSLGVAELERDETADLWYKRADNALYEAKNEGRNQTRLALAA